MVFEGTLDAQPLTAIPLQQYTMEELSYPSEDMVEEVGEVAEDVNAENGKIYQSLVLGNLILKLQRTSDMFPVLLCDVPFADISSNIAVPDRQKILLKTEKSLLMSTSNLMIIPQTQMFHPLTSLIKMIKSCQKHLTEFKR